MQLFRQALHRRGKAQFIAADFEHIPRIWVRIDALLKTGELEQMHGKVRGKRVFITTDKLRDPMKPCSRETVGMSKSSINARKRKQRSAGLIPEKIEAQEKAAKDKLTGWRSEFPELFKAPKFKTLGIVTHTSGY